MQIHTSCKSAGIYPFPLCNYLGTWYPESKARGYFGIYRTLTGRLMKFELYRDSKEIFEDLGHHAMYISVMATKKEKIRILAGLF